MMSSRNKAANFFNIIKRKLHGELSLTTGLLDDANAEIELSSYGRLPSSGSESPSGLLNGESLNVEPIADLDLFFERLYSYYCDKGLLCIIIKSVVELLSLVFTVCFSGLYLLFVDWNALRNAKCGMDAIESGTKPCDLAKEVLIRHPLTPFTLPKGIIVGYMVIFSIYGIFCFLRFFAQLKDTLGIRHFYHNCLHISDNEIQTISWQKVVDKVVRLQSSQRLCVVKDLSAHEVVMRLMRKENYLIGMINKGILAFPISQWVPGAGPNVKCGPDGVRYRLILTKTLEWTLNWCILQSMFDRNFCVRKDFITNPKTLRKRLMVVGIAMLLLSPFLVIFMVVYLFLRHAEQFYNHPSTASSQRWSNLSKWIYREFNEVDHLFKHRINSSVVHASEYLKQFPSPIISIIAKFISFVSGGFAAILIIIAFVDESLLEGHIFGRNLFWYAAVFGTVTAISRAAIADDILVLDPEGAMSLVVQHTHHMPKRWRGKVNTEAVRLEFVTLYQYTAMLLLEEILSIFLTPFLLIFIIPKRVDDILQFIDDFTERIDGVGDVCRFSAFDFQRHGNNRYGSPHNASRSNRSSQGKMEKSFLSFQSNYPFWEPNKEGKQFLSNLRTFREQKLREQNTRFTYSSSIAWRGSPPIPRAWEDRSSTIYNTQMPQNNQTTTDCHPDSLWLIDADQRNHPYLLDWFYTSPAHHVTAQGRDTQELSFGITEQNGRVHETRYDNRRHFWEKQDDFREQTNMEASSSAPFFQESVLRQHELNNSGYPILTAAVSTGGYWWNRNNPLTAQHDGSFIDPPHFINRYASNNLCDTLAESSRPHSQQPSSSLLETSDKVCGSLLEKMASSCNTRSDMEPPAFTTRHTSHEFYNALSERRTSTPDLQPGTSYMLPPDFTNHFPFETLSVRHSPQGTQPDGSFIEPPDFINRGRHYDSLSEVSMAEEEEQFPWSSSRRLTTTAIDDIEDLEACGNIKLHFDDIYTKPPDFPTLIKTSSPPRQKQSSDLLPKSM